MARDTWKGLKGVSINIDTRLWSGAIFGEGGRRSSGAPVIMQDMGTLCATASMDCHTADLGELTSKTTATDKPGTTDQWERGT